MIKLKISHLIGMGFGLVLAIASFFIFRDKNMLYFFLVISLIIITLPFFVGLMISQGKQKEKEEKFLAFSRDLVENVKSGTPISKSIINLKNRDYGALTSHIGKMANQLSLGMTLSVALNNFAKDTGNPVIHRAVGLISEAEKAGGQIETILGSVTDSVNQTEILKKERKAAISNLVTQGYIIFLVFIVIMLVMEFKILPLVSGVGDTSGEGGLSIQVQQTSAEEFAVPLFVMLLVQAFFTGLIIGKISEGNIMNGVKHSFVLLTITLLVTTGVRAFIGG